MLSPWKPWCPMPVVGRPCPEAQRKHGCDGPGLPRMGAPPEKGPGPGTQACWSWGTHCGRTPSGLAAPRSSGQPLVSLQILGLTFAMTMYCQVVKADTYCA